MAHRVVAWSLGVAGMLAWGSAGAMPLAGFVRAEEPMDAPLPEISPKQLAARLREAWTAYDKGLLEITFETTANSNWRFMMNQGSAAEQAPIIVRFPGRVRFQRDGRLWRVDYDSKMPRSMSKELSAYAFRAGFDGEQLYGWNKMRNELTLGEATGGAENWKPREAGQPIAGANVDPTKWHHRNSIGGEVSTTPSGAHAVKSGAAGRFQLRPLRQGRFTLEVTAPGFETRICDPVPSGTDNAELILERSKSPAPAKR